MSYLLILGGGESGVGAAILAQKVGLPCRVSDKGKLNPQYREELEKRGIPYEEGKHSPDWILGANEVIKPRDTGFSPPNSRLYKAWDLCY